MPPYPLVIFDFDRTLADSGPWFRDALNDLAGRYSFRRVDSDDEADALRKLSSREIIARLGIRPWQIPFLATEMRRRAAVAWGYEAR